MTVVNSAHLYGRIAQIIPQRLYFASFQVTPQNDQHTVYFPVAEHVHYDAFYDDFGPLNLAVLYRFCEALHELLQSDEKRKIVIFTDDCDENRANAACLVASYMVIHHHTPADRAYALMHEAEPPEYVGFRDAAMGPPSYLLPLKPVVQSVEKAVRMKWLDFGTFDADEYEHYERVENGDFNWIIPKKILSFCGPHNRSYIENGYPFHAPEVYFDYFRRHKVSTIVRLNKKLYDAKRFTDAGFDHRDLFFIDGSTPSDDIVLEFIDVVDQARGGVAIHCKAGLGRTGTLIACWMMKEYRMTAAQCMGWLRICRPGSVIGPQQQFLIAKQQWCWSLKESPVQRSPLAKRRSRSPPKLLNNAKVIVTKLADELDDFALGDMKSVPNGRSAKYSLRSSYENGNNNTVFPAINDETAINEFGQSQGDRLLEVKAKAQHSHNPPPQRKPAPPPLPRFSSATTPIKQLKLTHRPRPTAGVTTNGPVASSACRNLTLAKMPISKVTVSTCYRSTVKSGAKKIRIQPYPPTVGLDLKTSTTLYDLRPRQKLQLPPRYDYARTLSPNTSAFIPSPNHSHKPSTRL